MTNSTAFSVDIGANRWVDLAGPQVNSKRPGSETPELFPDVFTLKRSLEMRLESNFESKTK